MVIENLDPMIMEWFGDRLTNLIDNNLDDMPYSTRLYFLKVQEIMSSEMDKSLV